MVKAGVQVRVVFNRLPQIAGSLATDGAALVQQTADNIATGAQDRAPVDTGELRDSIHVEGSGQKAAVVVDADHGVYVEYGTSRMGAQPFLWPSLEAERPVYLAAWRSILAGLGQRAGSATVLPGRGTIRRRTGGRLPR